MRETHTANHGEIKILFMSSTELNFKTTRQGGIIKNTIKKNRISLNSLEMKTITLQHYNLIVQ